MIVDTKLSASELRSLTDQARIMEEDSHGAKVYRLENGNYLKIFRRKRFFSSALLNPYSKRFITNAEALTKRGIPTIRPLAHFSLDAAGCKAVLYEPLQGDTLRFLASSATFSWNTVIQSLTELIKNLHDQGIYFRSLHIGNIVFEDSGRLGLIDIADMKIFNGPLSLRHRKRNLEHFKRYLSHENLLASFPLEVLETKVLNHKSHSPYKKTSS